MKQGLDALDSYKVACQLCNNDKYKNIIIEKIKITQNTHGK